MNAKEAEKMLREIAMTVCTKNKVPSESALKKLEESGYKTERMRSSFGLDGLLVSKDGDELYFLAAPREYKPRKKQKCVKYAVSDFYAYGALSEALAKEDLEGAEALLTKVEAKSLRAAAQEGIDSLWREKLEAGEVTIDEPTSDQPYDDPFADDSFCDYEIKVIDKNGKKPKSCCIKNGSDVWTNCREVGHCVIDWNPKSPDVKPKPYKKSAKKSESKKPPKAPKAPKKTAKKPETKVTEVVEKLSIENVREWVEGKNLRVEQANDRACVWVCGDSKEWKEEFEEAGFRWGKSKKYGKGWWKKPAGVA